MTNKLPEVGKRYAHWKFGHGIYKCRSIDRENIIHMEHTLKKLPLTGMYEEDRNIYCKPDIFWNKFKELPDQEPTTKESLVIGECNYCGNDINPESHIGKGSCSWDCAIWHDEEGSTETLSKEVGEALKKLKERIDITIQFNNSYEREHLASFGWEQLDELLGPAMELVLAVEKNKQSLAGCNKQESDVSCMTEHTRESIEELEEAMHLQSFSPSMMIYLEGMLKIEKSLEERIRKLEKALKKDY